MTPRTRAWIETGVIAIIVALFIWWVWPSRPEMPVPQTQVATSTAVFFAPQIEAQAAIVFDAATGETIYEKNADAILPLASLTKLMTAYTAYQIVPSYLIVRITPDDIREEGDSGLFTNEEWNLDKLIDYSLVVSSNDGARAIAAVAGAQIFSSHATSTPIQTADQDQSQDPQHAFISRMNEMAHTLGLSSMRFNNPSGLDVSTTESGGYGSARDVAKLVSTILNYDPHILEATTVSASTIDSKSLAHQAGNTNVALGNIPGAIASKTGYTELSGGNLVVAFNAGINHPVIIAALGSTYDGRFADVSALVRASLDYLSEKSQ